MTTPFDRVKVRIAVREIERYERVIEMPRALFEENRRRLAQASPDVVGDVACLLVDCFVDNHGDDFDELTEIEAFELVDSLEAASLEVFDGYAVGPLAELAALADAAQAVPAVDWGLDPDSLEQGEAF